MNVCRRVLLIAGARPSARALCSRLEARGVEVHVIPVSHAQVDAQWIRPHVVLIDADLPEDACMRLRHVLRARVGAPVVCIANEAAAQTWRERAEAHTFTTSVDDAEHLVMCLLGNSRRPGEREPVSDTSSC